MERSMVDRMKGAAFLDIGTYEEVEHDEAATLQAAVVVAMVAVAGAIGASPLGILTALGTAVLALVGWLIWAGVTYLIGDKLFGGTATWGELLRTLGFAQAPGLLMILGFIPFLGPLVMLVAGLWMLMTAFVAIRQALDFGNGKTLATVVVGWLCYMVLAVIFLR